MVLWEIFRNIPQKDNHTGRNKEIPPYEGEFRGEMWQYTQI